MARPDVGEPADRAREAGKSVYRSIVDVILTGIVVIVPLVITLFVLQAAFNFIANALRPFIQVLKWAGLIESVKDLGFVDFLITVGVYSNVVEFLTTITALFILLLIIVTVGLLARIRYGERLIHFFDAMISSIPAVGSIYGSFRRMGDAMLESSVDNFQEVVLVEYPDKDLYLLGFKTNDTPMPIVEAADESSMTTLFLPLAPNPVMGGFLAHIPDEKVRRVDMTVEDAVRIIITSGIATQSPDSGRYRALSDDERKEISKLVSIRDSDDGEGSDDPDGNERAPRSGGSNKGRDADS